MEKNNRSRLNKRERQKRQNDVFYRILDNARGSIQKALRKQYSRKNTSSAKLIGMTGKALMSCLLSHDNCPTNFTAENYGTVWHLDHIKPLAAFDLSDSEQQKQAFHFTNCQPLAVKDNLSKGSLWEGERHTHGNV